jgi:hypothetical protein
MEGPTSPTPYLPISSSSGFAVSGQLFIDDSTAFY